MLAGVGTLVAFLLIGQMADMVSTQLVLERVEGSSEANPLIAWVFDRGGYEAGYLLKLFVVALTAFDAVGQDDWLRTEQKLVGAGLFGLLPAAHNFDVLLNAR